MSRIIDKGLEEQSALLTRMGELTYETLTLSDIIVAMAGKVEDKTFELIARFQPVASDLRAIKSYMKIANDFARYGRYALDISSLNDQLKGVQRCEAWTHEYIVEMSEKVLLMVKTSIDSLRKHDVALAKTISSTEREVDKMYLEFLSKITAQEYANSKCDISSILVTRYLERIADHATYICESIVYIVTGEKLSLG